MPLELMFVVDGVEDRAMRYINPDGSLGGWVSKCAKIDSSAYIDPSSVVGPWAVLHAGHIVPARQRIGMVPPSELR